jgi:porphobilinogen synthase
MYPNRRPRRNRKTPTQREMLRETILSPHNFIYPIFLVDGSQRKIEIKSMPGIYRFSLDLALQEIEECMKLDIFSFIVFPAIEDSKKDTIASYSYDSSNFYLKSLAEIKKKFPETFIVTDVAMDPYSSDGHDGLVQNGKILNDETLPILAKMSIAQAETGIDMIGPSDMMDGRVGYLRKALDDAGFSETGILSYSAKYASSFYGPFRDALDSAPKLGDKKTYQMNIANAREAELEAELDFIEGADMLMVKPALCYLDIIYRLKLNFRIPIVAYNVSGEYSMLHASAKSGYIDLYKGMEEILLSIKRSGADILISYHAKEFLQYKHSIK